jgi:hypothetical protein
VVRHARHARLATLLSVFLVGCGAATGTAEPGEEASAPITSPPASPATPTLKPTTEPDWMATIVGDAPILDASAIGDVRHVLAGALVLADDTVHGWVIGFGEAVGDQAPYHVSWPTGDPTTMTIDPAVVDIGLEFADPGPIPHSVAQQPDGPYAMYGWGTITAQEQAPVLWRASAETLAGPWTAAPGVVFLPANAPAWDSARIDFPTVLSRGPGAFVMTYEGSGVADPDVSHIGIARSRNGVTWTHEDVPVLSPGLCGNGDDVSISGPRAMTLEAGLVVAYVGREGNETRGIYLGEAQPDGSWACQTPAPILSPDAFEDSGGIHSFAALAIEGDPHLVVEILSADFATSALWLVRLDPVTP